MDIFYYIYLLLLIIIVILITIYITKVNSKSYLTCTDIKNIQNNSQKLNNNINNIYDFKISKEFDKMFNQSSILNGYENFNNNDSNIKPNINN